MGDRLGVIGQLYLFFVHRKIETAVGLSYCQKRGVAVEGTESGPVAILHISQVNGYRRLASGTFHSLGQCVTGIEQTHRLLCLKTQIAWSFSQ